MAVPLCRMGMLREDADDLWPRTRAGGREQLFRPVAENRCAGLWPQATVRPLTREKARLERTEVCGRELLRKPVDESSRPVAESSR